MPIVRRALAVCDRCGAREEFDPSLERPLSASPAKGGGPLAGWVQLRDGACLCGDCHDEYQEMLARHKREVREFMGKETVEFDI